MKIEQDNLRYYNKLIQTLRLLASDYQTQVSYFPKIADIPNELASIFDDYYILVPQILNFGLIDESNANKLNEIDQILTRMSNSKTKEYFTLESVKHDPNWQEIRMISKGILSSLNQDGDLIPGLL